MIQNGLTVPAVQILGDAFSSTQANAIMQEMVSVFNHRLSCIGQIDVSDLNSIPATGGSSTVGGAYPFVYAMTCGTGDFPGSGQDTSEEWLIPPTSSGTDPKGAIGCVGLYSTGTHVPFNNILDAGAMYGLYVLDIPEQGIVNIAGKLELYRNYATASIGDVQNFSYWSNLMGDPAVSIWHKAPSSTTVSHAASIQRGTNHLSVTVTNPLAQNVEGALVCLLKGTETFARGYTNSSGQIDLPIATPTTGSLQVTVTKDDQLPYLGSVTVTSPVTNLVLNSIAVDDDDLGESDGDNDDIFNPGETIELDINVLNNGTTNLTNVAGTLTSQSPGVVVRTGFQNYGAINAGVNADPEDPYLVSVVNVFNNEPVTLFLNLSADQGSFVIRLDFTPVAPDVTYLNMIFGGAGGNLDPGESGTLSITMQNSGARPLEGADAILRSLDDRVSVTDSVGFYGNVNPGISTINAGNAFAISISGAMFNGHTSAMQLVVYDDTGFRDSTDFNLTIGTMASTSPSGPDAFGYYAFDITETQPASAAASYSWIEISGTGTNLGMSDVSEDDDDAQVHTLPFTFRYYGNDFTQMTICSNGWAAFGSYPEIRDFRNYRMGSPIGPPNQLAPYWDDLEVSGVNNVFKWHNTVDHYFVIEWRAQTQWTNVAEIFEIIIYDPAYYPSASGNGKIKFQYNTVSLSDNPAGNDNAYASVGIQNQDHSVAVDYYFGMNVSSPYGPGAATISNGRAIMFTTDDTGSLIPTVTLGAPNGGESYYLGQSTNITWSSSLIPGSVSIELNRSYTPGPGTWETIIASTTNDGTHPWTLSGAASTTSRIRVRSVSNPAVGDSSNANFTIATPTVTLTSPNGGELLAPGATVDVTWSDVGLGVATLELNRDYPVGAWELLSNSATSGYEWLVTTPTTDNARIRVTGNAWPATNDVSNANFLIGVAPVISHKQKCDQIPGAAVFVSTLAEDNPATVTFNLYYRAVGGGAFSAVAFAPTGNPGEFSATIPGLVAGDYEYYLECIDTEGLMDRLPDSGQLAFDVNTPCTAWTGYDDGTAENYNWVDGHDYEWAVRFDPGSYPFSLCAAEYAVNPTNPTEYKAPVEVKVYLADGPSGMPGTLVLSEVTGTVNAAGGLPTGAAWSSALFSTVVLGAPFYVSVENVEPRECPVAFGLDTGTNSGNSYYYDWCEGAWFSENHVAENSRPGNRMIRISGYSLQAPDIVVRRSGNDIRLNWSDTNAPYYKVYSATTAAGPFSTFEGSTADTFFTDTGVVPVDLQRFYEVQSSATP
ncbi:hypothetical protein IT157_02865 [bacterium]|nr:hypothetical protein [bacterium]